MKGSCPATDSVTYTTAYADATAFQPSHRAGQWIQEEQQTKSDIQKTDEEMQEESSPPVRTEPMSRLDDTDQQEKPSKEEDGRDRRHDGVRNGDNAKRDEDDPERQKPSAVAGYLIEVEKV